MGADVQYACSAVDLPALTAVQRWVDAALPDTHAATELTVRIVDEPEGRDLNHRFRGRDNATNVLSFPSDLPEEIAVALLGDIVICAPVVSAEAAAQAKSTEAHYAHLVVHGVLHLLGYDHIDDVDAQVMEAKERDILAILGFPNPMQRKTHERRTRRKRRIAA